MTTNTALNLDDDPLFNMCIPAGPGRPMYILREGANKELEAAEAAAEAAKELEEAENKKKNKSTGPKTPAGKDRSSRNAMKHGGTAKKHFVLDIEDPAEFAQLRAITIDQFRPTTPFLLNLVEDLAHLQWRKDRLTLLETAYLNHQINPDLGIEDDEDPMQAAAQGSTELAALVRSWLAGVGPNGSPLELLRRYITTLNSQYNQTLNNILKLEKRDTARRHDPSIDPEAPYREPQLPEEPPQVTENANTKRTTPTPAAIPGEPTPTPQIPRKEAA